MLDNMNLDYLKLLYCEFQMEQVMTMYLVGGQPKKKKKTRKNQLWPTKTHRAPFSNLWLL